MPTPLVVLLPSSEREALRSAGVLPPAWFRDVGAPGWNGDGTVVRLWTEEPDWAASEARGEPSPPAQLLGLSGAGRSSSADENLVAKLFGSVILHVVFLDDEDATGGRTRPNRDPTTAWVGVEPILRTARWARAFNRSVEYWFAEEQSRNIRHAVLVVARRGRVRVSPEQLEELQREFSETGTLQTCFFLDVRLEVELGNDALHSDCLWPVLAGRLLLRLLVALSGDGTDDIFLPGVHLWRSFEFLFDYPVEEMTDMVTGALNEAYRRLGEQTDADGGGNGAPPPKPRLVMKNKEATTFPGLPTTLTQFGPEPLPPVRDWHVYPATAEAQKRLGDDEKRWAGRMAKAREDFAKRERELFREEDPGDGFSPRGVFPAVGEDPRSVSIEMRRLESERPSDTISGEEVYRRWTCVVAAEKNRQEAKTRLETAEKELTLAQAHYVTAPYGMLVSVAVSLFCGYTLFRALWSFGGNGALPVAGFFAGLSAFGAFAAWWIVSWIHRRAGRRAANQFIGVAEAVDAGMDLRHGAAAETVRTAETQHRTSLRSASWSALHRLLERVWRILSHELQSPSLSAFYRTGGAAPAETTPTAAELQARKEVEVFLSRTRFAEVLQTGSFLAGQRDNSDRVLAEALEETGESSFRAFWQKMCDEADPWHDGNLPAKTLIPEIRRWLGRLCDRLSAAQKADLLAARGMRGILPVDFGMVRGDTGYVFATSHVDDHEVRDSHARVFVFEEPRDKRSRKAGETTMSVRAQALAQGAFMDIPVTATSVLNGLPQVAFYFQDIRLFGLSRAPDGRLGFKARYQMDDKR